LVTGGAIVLPAVLGFGDGSGFSSLGGGAFAGIEALSLFEQPMLSPARIQAAAIVRTQFMLVLPPGAAGVNR
jgi:hypothetical protein